MEIKVAVIGAGMSGLAIAKMLAKEGKAVTVITSHFDLIEDARQMAVDVIKEKLSIIDTPVILMGDFNASFGSSIINQLQEELTSVYRPTMSACTFSTTAPSSKIDYIFCSEELAFRDPYVPVDVNESDHLPVVVTVGVRGIPIK